MGKKVFVVDDSVFILEQIKDILSQTEFEVAGYAKDGETALEIYEQVQPDAVTLDIIMPGMDGIDTAKLMLEKWPDAKIVMMSSLGDDEIIEQAKEIGIQHFICKPIEENTLLDVLKVMLDENLDENLNEDLNENLDED